MNRDAPHDIAVLRLDRRTYGRRARMMRNANSRFSRRPLSGHHPAMDRQYYVYILASRPRGALYVGMTNDLRRRVWEHRSGVVEGHTNTYEITQLVWYEVHATAGEALRREKRIKHWLRSWKIDLIERGNPGWRDLWWEIASG